MSEVRGPNDKQMMLMNMNILGSLSSPPPHPLPREVDEKGAEKGGWRSPESHQHRQKKGKRELSGEEAKTGGVVVPKYASINRKQWVKEENNNIPI